MTRKNLTFIQHHLIRDITCGTLLANEFHDCRNLLKLLKLIYVNLIYFAMANFIVKKLNCGLFRTNKTLILKRLYCTPDSSDQVVVTKQKKVTLIGINRPEKRNAINEKISKQLVSAFEAFENDDDAYAAVLYGKGGNFCSGYDLKEIADGNSYGLTSEKTPVGPTKRRLTKPVVAAINGYAVAGGFELALWCDLRVVEETAIMGFFNRRFGIPLINGSTVRLPQLIGLSRALDLILTGRSINAREAFEIGLATKITACGTGIGNAINLANSLCKFPQDCLRADRMSAYHATYDTESLEKALKFEYQNSKHVLETESTKGAEKFLQGVGRHGSFHLDIQKQDVS